MPESREPFQLDAAPVCRADHWADAANHDPLIVRSLNRFSVANQLALVRGGSFLDTTPAKEHTTAKEWKCRRGGPGSACEFIEYRLSESLRRIPSPRSRCPIDESKWSGA
jgi:hypothetical protein